MDTCIVAGATGAEVTNVELLVSQTDGELYLDHTFPSVQVSCSLLITRTRKHVIMQQL